jgi:hypothetical protein
MLFALALATAGLLPNGLPAQVNEKVEVDGKKYRVWIHGRIVKVYDKSTTVRPNLETGQRMQAAVRKLTGCEISDPVWVAAHLEGVLQCPAPAAG